MMPRPPGVVKTGIASASASAATGRAAPAETAPEPQTIAGRFAAVSSLAAALRSAAAARPRRRPAGQPRINVGAGDAAMLVANQHDLDIGVLVDVVDEVQRVARQAEDMRHALGLQSLGDGTPDSHAGQWNPPSWSTRFSNRST